MDLYEIEEALLLVTLVLAGVKTFFFRKYFPHASFLKWLHFDNYSIYSPTNNDKRQKAAKIQNNLTFFISLILIVDCIIVVMDAFN